MRIIGFGVWIEFGKLRGVERGKKYFFVVDLLFVVVCCWVVVFVSVFDLGSGIEIIVIVRREGKNRDGY